MLLVAVGILGIFYSCNRSGSDLAPPDDSDATSQSQLEQEPEQNKINSPDGSSTTSTPVIPETVSDSPASTHTTVPIQEVSDQLLPTILVNTSELGPLDVNRNIPLSNPLNPLDPDPPFVPCAETSDKCRYLRLELLDFEPGEYVVVCENDGWNFAPRDDWHHIPATIYEDGSVNYERPFCYINFATLTGERGERVTVRGPKVFVNGEESYPGEVKTNWFKEVETPVAMMH